MSKTLSIMPAPFSNCMEYEKPEQPPPTTPTRRPAGTGFCCDMISLTFATAFEVRVMGAFFTSGVGVTGVVVVAIHLSLSVRIPKLYQSHLQDQPETQTDNTEA